MTQPSDTGAEPGWASPDPAAPPAQPPMPPMPPAPGPPPQGMAFGPPPSAPPPSVEGTGKTSPLAWVALLTGLAGLNLVAIGVGIAALVKIRRTGARGRGIAIGGIIAGTTWLVVALTALTVLVVREVAGNASAAIFPKPGQCFDIPRDGTFPLKDCRLPHDAEMILTFKLPKGDWPGDKEVTRGSERGCDQRIRARYGTRAPIEDGGAYAIGPTRFAWNLGDRNVFCAIGAFEEGDKLTAPIGPGPSPLRLPDELKTGDCFTRLKNGTEMTKIARCDAPHGSQVTHRFELPPGTYPGDSAILKQSKAGCDTRWRAMFAKKRPPVRLELQHRAPHGGSWALGDRAVLCTVNGAGGRDLTRSVVPG